MTDTERQLAEIDRRRAQLEIIIGNLPPIRAQCCDYGRAQLEDDAPDKG
jgi:hypothetical protein